MPANPLSLREREEIRTGIAKGELKLRCVVAVQRLEYLIKTPELAAHVTRRLEAKDSPMTITVELANGVYPDIDRTVSHETIYIAVYDPHRCLPRGLYKRLHRRRSLRRSRRDRRSQQRWRHKMQSISTRPAIASERHEVGHFEGDLILGRETTWDQGGETGL